MRKHTQELGRRKKHSPFAFWRAGKGASDRGFTLIELAISVSILGLLSAGVLTALSTYRNVTAYNTTMAHMARIQGALTFHAIRTSQLPVPAGTAALLTGGCRMGNIPHTLLGISQEETRDGWGQSFIYVVDTDFTDGTKTLNTGQSLATTPSADLDGGVSVDDMGCSAADQDLCPAYVLVSRGGADDPGFTACDLGDLNQGRLIYRTMTPAQIIRDAQ